MRGHTRKRGKTWSIVLSLGKDSNGKRKQKWIGGFATQREAEREMRKILNEVDEGTYIENKQQTVASYFAQWLEDKELNVRYNTIKKYKWLTNIHVIPNLGKIALADLNPQHLQWLYTKLQKQDKPLANRSILHMHNMIHEALSRAVKWGFVTKNVADAVDPPRAKNKEMETWTEEEITAFLDAIHGERYELFFWIAIATGMRKAEIGGLRWKDVDFENARLNVRQSLVYKKTEPVFEELKTDKSRRVVSVPYQIMELLKHHKAEQAEEKLFIAGYKDHGLVFARPDGTPMSYSTLQNIWLRGINRSGVKRIRIHDLRHTHATMLFEQGIEAKLISEKLGHSRINVTLDIYTHVKQEQQDEVAQKFGERLFNKRAK